MTDALESPRNSEDLSSAVRNGQPMRGLRFSRIYTKEGVHPYDEILWERRDVVMTNWRDGSVNFEQRGVEFPDFWSVNATNIVTTKYFRGAIGTPQRESSLRQLIDRVVNKYRTSGDKRGYFASSDDASIFEHELTWMLLHQVFSFNSPVWFNVGTESPNQVSACFILSVDDTMESILNWYKEEGMIFKGGSGAGVNLSRIRSSKELLSSGGRASGPVSFMRGADASAGTIKSGGATRRAAKMVVLDVDHPDIDEFIKAKAHEEKKIRALRDAGFDMDLGGDDILSVQYQNANNSVRVSDEFMRAVENGDVFSLRARLTGEPIETVDARTLFRTMATAAWECADPGIQYDDTINDWHTNPETGRITASNPCSEYMSLDNSSCNLASLNLMKFLRNDDTFDIEKFVKTVELVTTAMDISICFADFPTPEIGETTRAYRQLGIGYANLGALLMATGHAYDSDGGRALAAAITSLMSGVAYRRSGELAAIVGPYEGFALNAAAHTRVMRKHTAANDHVRPVATDDARILQAATGEWEDSLKLGERYGWRNAQASVLAPTGCLTADALLRTDQGIRRLGDIGDAYGCRWQDLDLQVSSDDGLRKATKFFINGEEPTRRIITAGGYSIHGTLTHRVKVLEASSGKWMWRRLADLRVGDVVPIQRGSYPTEEPAAVASDEAADIDQLRLRAPHMTTEMAELIGYLVGYQARCAEEITVHVPSTRADAAYRIADLTKEIFGLASTIEQGQSDIEITIGSAARLSERLQTALLSETSHSKDRGDETSQLRVPSPVLESQSSSTHAAFLRGLFDANRPAPDAVASVTTESEVFANEVRTLLLALGLASTTRTARDDSAGRAYEIRMRSNADAVAFDDIVRRVDSGLGMTNTAHERRGKGVDYFYDEVIANEDGGIQPTFDLSVPGNMTYVANGFISHNTIGLMMDCDTTGVEPDLALVKLKKLTGGGSMQIVNQTVRRALLALGYTDQQVDTIVDYIAEHGHVVGAPQLREKHYEVFDCAMGKRAISPMGHIRMMAAVQPFLSGAQSKTVNLPESATRDDVEEIYFRGWKLGLKALAIYRDNCKVGQPLSDAKGSKAKATRGGSAEPQNRPVRKRLPKQRPAATTKFSVGGTEGYLISSSYPDDGLGEVFLKMSKQGSTLAGIMDAFSIAISIGLQYGVPLETYVQKFVNMRFDPAGLTDDEDIRIASSVLDYIFRRLALDFLPPQRRAELGVFTAAERTAMASQDTASLDEQDQQGHAEVDIDGLRTSAPIEQETAAPTPEDESDQAKLDVTGSSFGSSMELLEAHFGTAADAPLCFTCGTKMRPSGACYVCEGCGSTSGCS